MKAIGISKIETSIFIEYIRNYISDSLSEFHDNCSRTIERTSSGINLSAFKRDFNRIVSMQIVQPYTAFIEQLTSDINRKLCEYFGLEQGDLIIQPLDCHIYEYRIDCNLVEEYGKTEMLSRIMEKLINKTLDFTCLDQMKNPVIKTFIDPLSVGSLFMSSLGLDSSILRERHRQEFCKVLKGIGKNISIRIGNHFLKQYTNLIYQIMEENQEVSSYEQAI